MYECVKWVLLHTECSGSFVVEAIQSYLETPHRPDVFSLTFDKRHFFNKKRLRGRICPGPNGEEVFIS